MSAQDVFPDLASLQIQNEHNQLTSPQRVILLHFDVHSTVQNLYLSSNELLTLAHRVLVHHQTHFNCNESECRSPINRTLPCVPNSIEEFNQLQNRIVITSENEYFSSIVNAEMFVDQYNAKADQVSELFVSAHTTRMQLFRAFVCNQTLAECEEHVCAAFETICSCCYKSFWQQGGCCPITTRVNCIDCARKHVDQHKICRMGSRFERLLDQQQIQESNGEAHPDFQCEPDFTPLITQTIQQFSPVHPSRKLDLMQSTAPLFDRVH